MTLESFILEVCHVISNSYFWAANFLFFTWYRAFPQVVINPNFYFGINSSLKSRHFLIIGRNQFNLLYLHYCIFKTFKIVINKVLRNKA